MKWAIFVDYYAIGQRIRKYRRALNLSQETLAEKINISTTHMSHIETGNTKMSLPVLAAIAVALNVSTDSILFEEKRESKTTATDEIDFELGDCSLAELKIIKDIVSSTKSALRKHL